MNRTTNVDNLGHSEPCSIFTERIGLDIFGDLSSTQIRFLISIHIIAPSIKEILLR